MTAKLDFKDQRVWLFGIIAILCLLPIISSPMALIAGFLLATFGLVPSSINLANITKKLLALSIVGLGFGINLDKAIEVSQLSLPLVVGSIFITLALAMVVTKYMGLDKKTGYLVGAGTAICGGSAIAAVSPAIKANSEQMAVALACVFVLNAIALFVFPVLGHAFDLTQHQFGLWAAIAIHDTSSVVGAASAYGNEALLIATTTKLARALWIIPVALLSALLFGGAKRIQLPLFIVFYIVAILINHYLPQGHEVYALIFAAAKRTLVLCLFLIGAGMTIRKMRAAGPKPMILALLLWLVIATGSLSYILLAT